VNGERIIDAIALHVRRPLALAAFALAATLAHGQSAPPLRKYVASPDYPALLKEPMVKVQLLAVVGKALPALMRNLSVAADVEWIGGALAVHGNAPHGGGEEEAVICVSEYDGKTQAAMLSKGRISVFAKDARYDDLMVCIKDWITQVNSGHRDRFAQPKNVAFGKPN
jgi:hypothetical protein